VIDRELAPKGVSDTCQERGNSRKLITFVHGPAGARPAYAIDAGKIKRGLGWVPAHTFEQGIAKRCNGISITRNGGEVKSKG